MIGKVPKAGRGFRGLINYLLRGSKTQQHGSMPPSFPSGSESRVAWCEMRNMLITDPELAPKLMRATAYKSKRVKSPVYHYVISWHPDDAPSDDFMRQVADTTCADLGLSEHQLIYVAHRDTDHHHVHIVANRVHPETGVAWNRRQDWVRIEKSLRRQSETMGLEITPGRHTDPDAFKKAPRRTSDGDIRRRQKYPSDAPTRQWTKSMAQERRSAIADAIEKSSSWGQLSRALDAMGYRLMRKGQGLVISDGEAAMKLSDVGRHVRMRFLEDRFGQSFDEHDMLTTEPTLLGGTVTVPVAQPAVPQPQVAVPPPEKRESPAPQSDPRVAEDRARISDKFDTLKAAKDAADFAQALQRMGLASDRNVTDARAAVVKAADDLNCEKSVVEQLVNDISIPGTTKPLPKATESENHQSTKSHAKPTLPSTKLRPRHKSRRRYTSEP